MLSELNLGSAVSIENREAYGAENRPVEKIFEEVHKGTTYIYYRDSEGWLWYWSSAGSDIDRRIEERKAKKKRRKRRER